MSHTAEISFFMASSRLIARHARETSGRLAPAAHFAKYQSRRNGNFLRTRCVWGRYRQSRKQSGTPFARSWPISEHPAPGKRV